MAEKKEKSPIVTVQGIDFNLEGLKGFTKTSFISAHEPKVKAAKGKGRWGRLDLAKAWESLEAAKK